MTRKAANPHIWNQLMYGIFYFINDDEAIIKSVILHSLLHQNYINEN